MEDNNKVGQYPHQIAIATSGNGFIYMIVFNPIANESKLVQLQLHNLVCTKALTASYKGVEIQATISQILVCAQKVMFIATSTGLTFVDMNGVFQIKTN